MKKLINLFLTALLGLSMVGCSSDTAADEDKGGSAEPESAKKKVVVLVPFIGDQSYFDTLNNGVLTIQNTMSDVVDIELKEVGNTTESATWQQWFDEYCEDGEYDLVVSGNSSYEAELWKACEKYPDQKFMNFDLSALPTDASGNEFVPENCYCVNYGLDDLGYVVGALSAALTQTGKVGVVVGMNNRGMNQFIGGWCQVLADSGVEYMVSYSYGDKPFSSADIGQELGSAQMKNGVDVIWQVAGGTGTGVIQACAEDDAVWCVGVDQDQYVQFMNAGDEKLANTIITSALKNTDIVLAKVVEMLVNGELDSVMGSKKTWGIAENAVGLAENDYYLANVSEDVRNEVAATLAKVASGDIEVIDTLEIDYDAEWESIIEANRLH